MSSNNQVHLALNLLKTIYLNLPNQCVTPCWRLVVKDTYICTLSREIHINILSTQINRLKLQNFVTIRKSKCTPRHFTISLKQNSVGLSGIIEEFKLGTRKIKYFLYQ